MEQNFTQTKKRRWYKKKSFYIIVVIGLILAGLAYGKFKSIDKTVQYETVKVERGNLAQTVDATGNIQSANEIDLRLEMSGKIAVVNKQVGESVEPGDIILELDLSELNARVAQAVASVSRAEANLNKLLAGDTEEYLRSMSAKVIQSQASYDQVVATYDSQISDAKAAILTAENNLKLSQGGEDSLIVEDAYDTMLALLNTVQNSLASSLTEADNILGIDNTLANNDFEDVLSALNSSNLNNANNKYYVAKSAKVDADSAINSLNSLSDHEQIDYAVGLAKEGLEVMKDLLYSVAVVLDSTVPIGDLSQTELSTLKTGIQTARTSVATQYSALIAQIQAIDTARNSYTTNKIAYDKAINYLENLNRKKEADVASYQALLDQAKANFEDAKSPPRNEDVASYRASLAEAQANLAQAVANRDKGKIIAPVAGTIGKIEARVGEYITNQTVAVKLVNPHFEIKVDIPETDIIKIALGNEAKINLDAYGDDVFFKGVVSEIEIGETVIQDVVYYTVTLSIEDGEGYNILNGMTADVLFYTEEKKDVLFVPTRTIRANGDDKYVRVLEGGELKEVKIKTGLRGDGGLVEVVNGLEEGQEVVVRVIE